MSTRNNRTLCRVFLQKVVNEGILALTPAFVSADSAHHEVRDVPPEYQKGPRAVQEFVRLYRRAFPDLCLKVEDEVVEGDRVVTRFRLEGTQTGPLMSIAPSGRRVSVEGIRIDRLKDGKIAESWMQWDLLLLLEQIGALPSLCRQPAHTSAPFAASVPQTHADMAMVA